MREPCDLSQLVTDICTRQIEQTTDWKITLTLPEDDCPVAQCAPAHAENIPINLPSIAMKYYPAGTAIDVVVTVAIDNNEVEALHPAEKRESGRKRSWSRVTGE